MLLFFVFQDGDAEEFLRQEWSFDVRHQIPRIGEEVVRRGEANNLYEVVGVRWWLDCTPPVTITCRKKEAGKGL